MKKTLALFVLALVLLLVALLAGVPQPTAPQPEPAHVAEAIPAPIVVPDATGKSHFILGDLVRAEATLANEWVLADQNGSLELLIDLSAQQVNGNRGPVALAIVLDRSGSMAGEKLERVRQAAKTAVARLADHDQVALVSYASDASLDLALTKVGGQRNRIDNLIDQILDGGGTNLSGGLEAALDALGAAQGVSARRIVLMSDGNANQGITDPQVLANLAGAARQRGITVSTLGVGLDFNEDLMTLVAQAAGGGYYYVKDARTVATAFDAELDQLQALAAKNVELALELGPGVSLGEAFGYRTEMRRGRLVIPVGDLASAEKRRVMIRFDISSMPAGSVPVARVVLSYARASDGLEREHQGQLVVVATQDERQIAQGQRPIVQEAFTAASAARAREEAAASFSAGDRAQAVKRLVEKIESTKQQNKVFQSPALNSQIGEMERTLQDVQQLDMGSSGAKDLVKKEKLRARQVFVY